MNNLFFDKATWARSIAPIGSKLVLTATYDDGNVKAIGSVGTIVKVDEKSNVYVAWTDGSVSSFDFYLCSFRLLAATRSA